MRGVEIRTLRQVDVPSCHALSADVGWTGDDIRWSLLVGVGEVFGLDDPDGGLAGAVVLMRYTDTYAAIGMMLVARRWQRQGLGRRLMRHGVARAGGVVSLLATDNGRPLYESLGFAALGRSTTYLGRLPTTEPASRPVRPGDLPAIAERDTATFGVDRGRLLGRLPSFARLRIAAGGYGAAWVNGDTTLVGPVVADDVATARALVVDLAAGANRVRLDVPDTQPDLAAWAATHLTAGDTVTVMSYRGTPPGDPSRLFLPFSVATG